MRDIHADIITAIETGEIKPFLLLHMNIDGTDYFYTDCDVPLVVGGNNYSPRRFLVDTIRYSTNTAVDSVKIELDNLDDALTSVFVGGTPQDSEIILKQVLINTDNISIIGSAVTWFQGELDEWTLDEGKIDFTVTSELVRWRQETMYKHSALCRWKVFKGTECAYAGGQTWCDRTYARCSALVNTDNFGGFRFLPSIVDSEVWWGRTRAI